MLRFDSALFGVEKTTDVRLPFSSRGSCIRWRVASIFRVFSFKLTLHHFKAQISPIRRPVYKQRRRPMHFSFGEHKRRLSS